MDRREYGTGSIHTQYRNGKPYWCARVDVPGPRRRQIAVVRSKRTHTKADMAKLLSELQKRAQANVVGPDQKVAEYMDWWLNTIRAADVKQGNLKPESLALYRQWARLYVNPYVGHIKLRKLKPEHVRTMISDLTDANLSPRIRNQARDLLSRACKFAVGEKLIDDNPCDYVSGSKLGTKLDDAPTPEQVEAILAANKDNRLYPLFYLILLYGLRSKDARSLKWDDVNFAEEEFTVQSKTRNGDRTLPMIADTKALLESIPKTSEYVFTNDQGKHLDDTAGQHWILLRWYDFREAAGLERKGRLHAARHAAAQAMRKFGVPIEVISDVLGHSNIAVTRGVYLKADKDQARKALSTLL